MSSSKLSQPYRFSIPSDFHSLSRSLGDLSLAAFRRILTFSPRAAAATTVYVDDMLSLSLHGENSIKTEQQTHAISQSSGGVLSLTRVAVCVMARTFILLVGFSLIKFNVFVRSYSFTHKYLL